MFRVTVLLPVRDTFISLRLVCWVIMYLLVTDI
jgi:hypothetical protein